MFLTDKIKLGEFRSAVDDLPEEDGTYLVLKFFEGKLSVAFCLDYTKEHGWNTDKEHYDSAIDFSDSVVDYFTVWTTCSYPEGVPEEEEEDEA